jgi:hypothetical protein
MLAEMIADGLEKTAELNLELVKNVTAELRRHYWIVDQMDCAKHLTDDEFEQLQGLIKKVELLKEVKCR